MTPFIEYSTALRPSKAFVTGTGVTICVAGLVWMLSFALAPILVVAVNGSAISASIHRGALFIAVAHLPIAHTKVDYQLLSRDNSEVVHQRLMSRTSFSLYGVAIATERNPAGVAFRVQLFLIVLLPIAFKIIVGRRRSLSRRQYLVQNDGAGKTMAGEKVSATKLQKTRAD